MDVAVQVKDDVQPKALKAPKYLLQTTDYQLAWTPRGLDVDRNQKCSHIDGFQVNKSCTLYNWIDKAFCS